MEWTRKYEALRLILAVLVCVAIPAVSMAESDGNPVEKFPPPCADSLQCDDNQVIAEIFALYYWRDRIDLDETYLDNGWQMARIRDYLARSPRIDSITIFAYASPEGAYRRNVWLSEQRAKAAKEYLLAHRPDSSALDPEDILLRPMHENWAGLEAELQANYHRHDREKVLSILRASVGNDTKKWRLEQLDGGYTYKYIIRRHMPRLRLATWICVWRAPEPDLIAPQPRFTTPFRGETLTAVPLPEPGKRTILALKTNLLYDAAAAINFAVEVPFNERFSLLYEHHCPWWLSDNNKYCLQLLSFGGEFRWWFAPRPRPASERRVQRDALMGQFLGLYGMGGKFDLQFDRTGCYQGEFFSVGLTYGYAMPLSKRLNIEFSVSAGYARIPHRHYNPTDDYELLIRDRAKSGTWHYFGPTKVEVSLVLPLLVNKKKGGLR